VLGRQVCYHLSHTLHPKFDSLKGSKKVMIRVCGAGYLVTQVRKFLCVCVQKKEVKGLGILHLLNAFHWYFIYPTDIY
jgi:hypothetical protein